MTDSHHLSLPLEGLSCASCVRRVETALTAVQGASNPVVNLTTGSVALDIDRPDRINDVRAALERAGYPPRPAVLTLDIDGMSCASCVGRVEKALKKVPGMTSATVNLAAETARISFLDGATDPDAIAQAVTDIGYPARAAAPDTQAPNDRQDEYRHLKRQATVAGALTLPVFVLEMGGHMVPDFHRWIAATIGMHTSWYIQFLLIALVLIGPGRSFFTKGIPALLRRAPDMNSLVAVGAGAAFAFSIVSTFLPALLPDGLQAVYFEAAGVIVTLILIGRMLEARAKGRTGAAIQKLVGLQARTAHVVDGDRTHDRPIEHVAAGDTILVKPGERVPTDGVILEGSSHIDESMMTGEPVPVTKAPGDAVTGGTVNGSGSFRFKATHVGQDTALAQIIRTVQDAQAVKLPIQNAVDRITSWFVPAVMAIAAVTALVWLAVGPEPTLSHALVAAVSVLIIACPCAMGLATPTSIMVGIGRASELGVLFRKGDALQLLDGVDVVAFDKTGTLTEGHPELTDLILANGQSRETVLPLIAAVENQSEHPIAKAITRAAREDGLNWSTARNFASTTGFGVRASVDGHDVMIGAGRYLSREGIDLGDWEGRESDLASRGRTALFAVIDGRVAALVGVSDPMKPASRATITALHAVGLKVAMITGDKRETAEAIGTDLGIDHIIADVLPDGKVTAIEDLKSGGRTVAFVGDGINDAPALAHADIGIAIGTGTDVAIEAADVVLMSDDLRAVLTALDVSRKTMRNIRENLIWAFGYNTALIPVAAGVLYPAFGMLLSPMLAAGAMALSSVFVLTNALRLRRMQPPHLTEEPRRTYASTLQPDPA
ncbi:heavy metal translocating P-type ATPase [Qingshengfaniella alkalisoli]|uniref:P-type Cu(2+) transporter n=1 Tax=Qingshengfaniella alkalisoli TaxID=2599296 RepID=A0A5B8J084_9RHOB|nr:heavy metal translocating P-type ATPase [Qingshengfaniella alkalisoli]QDY71314.1 copper-translocating P-type ATPase [Qingshengfaniella alkalisoli]